MHVSIHRVPWKAVIGLNVRAGSVLYTCMSNYIGRLSSLTHENTYEHAPLSPEGMVTQKLCMCKIKHGPGNHASAAVPRRHRVPCKAGAGCTHKVPPGEKAGATMPAMLPEAASSPRHSEHPEGLQRAVRANCGEHKIIGNHATQTVCSHKQSLASSAL